MALAGGGGGGSSGPPRGGGGGRGRGDDGAQQGPGDQPAPSGLLQGWHLRVAADPEFPVKVLLEQVIGVGACVLGDMSSRPNWGLDELDFVFSTLVVGSLMNFTVMWLLAPTAAATAAAGGGLLTRILGGDILTSWGAPGSCMFEAGKYSVGSRLLNFGYKGVVFAAIGFVAGIAGTAICKGLITLRKALDPNFTLQNEQPGILASSGCWATHMGLSSNLRYQVLNGVDPFVAAALPNPTAFRVYQAGIRALNNVIGGVSFVVLARLLGVQKSNAPSPAQAAQEAASSAPGDARKRATFARIQ